jgi:hypothetical protein
MQNNHAVKFLRTVAQPYRFEQPLKGARKGYLRATARWK